MPQWVYSFSPKWHAIKYHSEKHDTEQNTFLVKTGYSGMLAKLIIIKLILIDFILSQVIYLKNSLQLI